MQHPALQGATGFTWWLVLCASTKTCTAHWRYRQPSSWRTEEWGEYLLHRTEVACSRSLLAYASAGSAKGFWTPAAMRSHHTAGLPDRAAAVLGASKD